jgi:cobalamin synthase
MCLHSHTCLPMPEGLWDEDLQPVSKAFLPAVGLAAGLAWWVLAFLCRWLLPAMLGAALIALFPFAVTAFENMRAFASVSGAFLEKKKIARLETCLQILPALLMLLQFAACASLRHIFALAMIPVLSRSCLVLMQLKPRKEEGEDADDAMSVPLVLIRIEQAVSAGALLLSLLFAGIAGLLCAAAVLAICWVILRGFSRKDCEIGDAEIGFTLTAAEFCGLMILSIL